MKLQVRAMQSNEEDLWLRLGRECNQDREEFQPGNILFPPVNELEPGPEVVRLLAEAEGSPTGRALVVKAASGSARLFDICVLPAARRQGIGGALLSEAEAVARTWKAKGLGVPYYLNEESQPLRAFFQARGYAEHESYSMMVDLTREPPAPAREKVKQLREEGFRLRGLTSCQEDIDLLSELQGRYFPGWPDGMLPASWPARRVMAQRLADDTAVHLFVEREGQTLGFVMGDHDCTTCDTRFVRWPGEGLLSSIAVAEEARRKGLATMLCLGLMDILRQHGNTMMCYGGVGVGSGSWKLAEGRLGGRLIKHYSLSKALAS